MLRKNALAAALFCILVPSLGLEAAEIIYSVNADATTCSTSANPPCYRNIQQAITAAKDALVSIPANTNTYSVLVEPSINAYAGGITLSDGINLAGRETARTIIDGAGTQTIVTATNLTQSTTVKNFTFRNGQIGVLVQNSTGDVNILNNIFLTNATAIQVVTSPNANIHNNTFHRNTTGISRDSDISIKNNIFSGNTTAINAGSVTKISNNAFFDNADQTVLGSNPVYIGNNPDPNPDFVNTDTTVGPLDFHLKTGSPCIDAGVSILGGVDSFDGSVSDIGAYGGAASDTIPMIISGLASSLTATTPTATISLSWNPNLAYQVNGYRVYYGLTSALTGTQAAEGASPLLVSAGTTTATLSNIASTLSATLAAPTLLQLIPMNESLAVSWSASAGATGYIISYSTSTFNETSLPATSVAIDGGTVTSYTLSGLDNLQRYYVGVQAVAQQAYFIAVTAREGTGSAVPGMTFESALQSPLLTQNVGTKQVSALSDLLDDFPEAATPTPDLPNKGCFIATAAYGYYSAPQVRVLREFRDRYLLTNDAGRSFVAWYYKRGPKGALFLNAHPWTKPVVRIALLPAVGGAFFLLHTPLAVQIAILLFLGFLCIYLPKKLRHSAGGRR